MPRELRDDEADNYQTLMMIIEECLEIERRSEWEDEFLRSIKGQLERKKTISRKQFDVLQKISAKLS